MRSFLIGPTIAIAALCVTAAIGEGVARIVLPPQQTVEIENVQKAVSSPAEAPKSIEETGHIDSVFEWGHQGIRLRPNIHATIHKHVLSGQDIQIDVNSLGMRYAELGPKENGEFRVLVLGDSITIGDYVQASETYPAVLEELAKGRSSHVRFINAGLPGASLSSEIYRYMEVSDAVRPDLVLVGMYLNDSADSKIFVAHGLPPLVAGSRLLSWIVNRLEFLRVRFWQARTASDQISESWKEEFRAGRPLHSGDMLNDANAMDFEVYNAPMDFGLAWNPRSWEIIEVQMRAFRQSVEASGAKLAVFLLPVHFQVKASIEDFRPQKSFLRMCRQVGVPCLDTLSGLRAEWARRHENLYYDHCHYRPYGNRVVASIVFPWLTGTALVP